MRAVIQLVSDAKVDVDDRTIAAIESGIVALVGIEKTDHKKNAEKLVERLLSFRIFPDKQGKTNLNLRQINGDLLLVPQFTLVAETQKGTRPGFSLGMPHAEGKVLFDYLVLFAKQQYPSVAQARFGAQMQVRLCNDGPVTFILEC